MTFNKYLKNKRNDLGLSTRELANKCGICFTTISRLETGKAKNPNIYTLIKLNVEAGFDMSEMLDTFLNNYKEDKK